MDIDPTKNYRPHVMALSPTTDLFGNEIKVGSRVRSFDHPHMFDDGQIDGMSTDPAVSDRISYVEGVVEAINDYSHGRGHPAYRILVDRDVMRMRPGTAVLMPSLEGSPDLDPPSELLINRVGERLCPPVNGTRSLMSGRTFGVIALPDEPGGEDRSVA